jgi:hypothetical protein
MAIQGGGTTSLELEADLLYHNLQWRTIKIVPEYDEEIKHWSLNWQPPLFPLHPRSSPYSFCCVLVLRINSCNAFSESKPLNQLRNRHCPILMFMLRFSKGSLRLNFNKIINCELVIMEVQQLEDIFSIVRTNLRAWRNILSRQTNGVSRRDDSVVFVHSKILLCKQMTKSVR